MSTQVQIRRGNTAQTAAFTGVVAELTVDTDKKVVVVHDGTTAGGIPLSKESTASTIFNHANGAFDKANSANVLAQAGYNQANTATTSAQAAFDKANQTAQLAFTTVSANGTSLVADANNDTLTITSAVANGIFVSGNSSTDALDIGLINSGVTASGYGDSISVPTFVVDTKGRLTSASNTTIRSGTTSQTGVVQLEDSVTSTSTSNAATPASVKTAYDLATTANNNAVNAGTYANAAFDKANSANVLAQSGYNQANTATTTAGLAYNHANGAFDKANTATTTADAAFAKANSANVIAQSAFDNSNTKFNSSGGSISGDVSVTGNLTIIGQTIYANTTTALIADNIITLNAAINQASAPTVDAGFEIDRGSSVNVSLLWNETSDKWTFTNDGTNYLNIADAGRLDSSFNHANGAFTVANSATTTAQNAYNLANGTAGVANTDYTTLTASAGTYGNASHVTVTTLTANGRVSSITNTSIAIDTAAITSGTLADARLPDTGTAGTYANASHVPVITTDSKGRVTAVTNTAISFPVTSVAGVTGAVSNTQLLNGILTVDGTGSGLDADKLDGLESASFANAAFANTDYTTISATAGVYGNASHVPVTTLTANGRVSLITNTAIAIDTAAITSGTLADARLPTKGTAGTYANATHVPVITTDAYGRVTAVTNTAISFPVTSVGGQTGAVSNTQLLNSILAVDGVGSGLDADLLDGFSYTAFANATFANTRFSSSGGSITGDVTVTGNLTIVGQTVYANTTTALIADNIITLNAAIGQASAPTVNAGIEVDRGSSANVLLLWNETTDKWQFTNDGSTYFDVADAGRLDSVFSLANGTAGVANTDYTTISTTAGVYGNASFHPVVTLTANGRVSSITNTAIAIDTAAITSGTLAVTRGGTGVTTSTGTGAVVLNTAPTLTSINVTNTTVSTSNTTGAITVSGGIGVKGNVSANGIIFDDGTRQTTAASGGATLGDVLALSIALG
jgi:hypothetical protein